MKVQFTNNKVPTFKNLQKKILIELFSLSFHTPKWISNAKKNDVQNIPFYLKVSNLKLKYLFDFVF
jgi:hypothetical protein